MENNKVKEFLNERFGEVRTINKDGELWFVARDICDILGIQNVSVAVNGNPKRNNNGVGAKHRDICNVYTLGGNQDLLCISEQGLYKLIFKSRKEFAEEFQDWICEEVIPAIRQDGMYVNREEEMESVNEQQRKELILNGLKNLTGKETKEVLVRDNVSTTNYRGYFEADGQKFANRNNLLFTKRAILNMGMLLTGSEVDY